MAEQQALAPVLPSPLRIGLLGGSISYRSTWARSLAERLNATVTERAMPATGTLLPSFCLASSSTFADLLTREHDVLIIETATNDAITWPPQINPGIPPNVPQLHPKRAMERLLRRVLTASRVAPKIIVLAICGPGIRRAADYFPGVPSHRLCESLHIDTAHHYGAFHLSLHNWVAKESRSSFVHHRRVVQHAELFDDGSAGGIHLSPKGSEAVAEMLGEVVPRLLIAPGATGTRNLNVARSRRTPPHVQMPQPLPQALYLDSWEAIDAPWRCIMCSEFTGCDEFHPASEGFVIQGAQASTLGGRVEKLGWTANMSSGDRRARLTIPVAGADPDEVQHVLLLLSCCGGDVKTARRECGAMQALLTAGGKPPTFIRSLSLDLRWAPLANHMCVADLGWVPPKTFLILQPSVHLHSEREWLQTVKVYGTVTQRVDARQLDRPWR